MRETLSSAKGEALQKLQHLHDQKKSHYSIPIKTHSHKILADTSMCCYRLTHVRFLNLGFVLKYKVNTIHTKKIPKKDLCRVNNC